jgi:hypothetical protein
MNITSKKDFSLADLLFEEFKIASKNTMKRWMPKGFLVLREGDERYK